MPSLLYETFIRFIAGLDFAMALNVLAGACARARASCVLIPIHRTQP